MRKVIQYIPRNMHTVFALLCFVVVIHWLIFPYPSGLLHWHCGNLTIAPVPAKQPWWIWINTSCEFIMNDCITTTKQSTTKPHISWDILYTRIGPDWCQTSSIHRTKSKLSSLADSTTTSDVITMVDVYNHTVKSCLDCLLLVRSKTITEYINCPCYNDEIRVAKQCRPKFERQWCKSRLDHHCALYVNQCKFVTTLSKRAKAEYYQTKVIEFKKDQRFIQNIVQTINPVHVATFAIQKGSPCK